MKRGARLTSASRPHPPSQQVIARLDLAGIENHPQRTAVIEAFFSSEQHVTAKDLALTLRDQPSPVSYSTVYRTLKLLVAHGLAGAHQHDSIEYEPSASGRPHGHLICTRCGAIAEFFVETLQAHVDGVGRTHRFEVERHLLEIFGVCATCRAGPQGDSA